MLKAELQKQNEELRQRLQSIVARYKRQSPMPTPHRPECACLVCAIRDAEDYLNG